MEPSPSVTDDFVNGILLPGEKPSNGMWPRSRLLWMAAFYMGLFIIRPWEQLFPAIAALHLERLYAIVMIIAVFLSGNKARLGTTTAAVLSFVSAILISAFCAYNSSLATDNTIIYLSLIIFYITILYVVKSSYDLVFLVISYIAIMTLYLGKSQWEFFVNGHHEYRMGVTRLIGIEDTFGGPNALAMSIVVSLPFAVFLWSNRRVISSNWTRLWQKRFRLGLLGYCALAVTSTVLTNSRSGMAGLALFIILVGFSNRGLGRKIKYSIICCIVLFVIWIGMPAESRARFQTIWAPEMGPTNAQTSAEGRIEGYRAGIEMFRRFPVTGVGVGNFVAYRVECIDGVALQAHNLLGQLLGETGCVGGASFLMLVFITFKNCLTLKRWGAEMADDMMQVLGRLGQACLQSLLLLLFLGAFGHNLYRFNWLWIAAFSALGVRFASNRVAFLKQRGEATNQQPAVHLAAMAGQPQIILKTLGEINA